MMGQLGEEAKQHAMGIGLTENEAEDAVNEFNANHYNDARFCEDCGARLNDMFNCENDVLDDYCNDCWGKYLKEQKQLEKGIKQLDIAEGRQQ